jgi:hypothetical protein
MVIALNLDKIGQVVEANQACIFTNNLPQLPRKIAKFLSQAVTKNRIENGSSTPIRQRNAGRCTASGVVGP